jgi:predicted acyl esterase
MPAMSEQVEFASEGVTLRADWYRPDGPGPFPTVVMGGGWCYVKELIQPEYARYFVEAGLACLVFDYRNFGESDGSPRQHINPWEQIEDYRNAISYVSTRPDVDQARIAAWGISYSGGHVLILGAIDSRVSVICSIVPMVNGLYNLRRANSNVGFRQLMDLIELDRDARYNGKDHGSILHSAHPHEAVSTWPSPDTWPVFKRLKETSAPNHEHWSTVASAEWVLTYDVAPFLERIIATPTLMVLSKYDDITMTEIEVPYYQRIASPTKRCVQIGGGASHMSIYDNPDHLHLAASACRDWMVEHL